MFIAMNRFKIVLGKEKEFENVWKNRDTHLDGVKGFKNFNLIKGDTNKEYSLYSSQTHPQAQATAQVSQYRYVMTQRPTPAT